MVQNESLTNLSNALAEVQKNIQGALEPLKELGERLNQFNCDLEAQLGPALEKFRNRLSELPNDLNTLATFNWLPDLSAWYFLPPELAKVVRENNSDEVDRLMSTHFKSHESSYFNELCTSHAQREHLFREIQTLARLEHYHGAIALLFSQIDGICFDVTSKLMFRSAGKERNYQPQVTSALDGFGNDIMAAFYELIRGKQTPSIAYEDNAPSELNRHKAIHGKDISFGTEMNYYKALSLLVFVHQILDFSKMKIQAERTASHSSEYS